ncbi:polyprenyl synthetase family protein [Actinoalloteichus hymeniacidonis]|uniref:Geranylgeranyl pyrophosphate synthase n=1 Tax=Actinoalloteichus hymeniacidonis TaxID=340345 RepID=A0AAC9HS74_9PSEU|nr:polyprenyl synthetase family protein [Actinoalloteichus hymeniacidonis]AOS64503.1 geranylgeranyl pyrophosphate synthase [Actinoalloteichus hymeniacidonis]MBB5907426.1 geranylgeranyl diphosphate synthase type I [Actinoalloteichus hymeniacidonis]
MTATRILPSALTSGVALVEPALREAVGRLCPQMSVVGRYHHGWADAQGREIDGWGGKLLRPTLAILSARAAGAEPSAGVPAGVAIELVHNFSLLHDDIMDGDTERRGRATAWTLFGVPRAILAGDALLTAAATELLAAEASGARTATASLMAATQRMIRGQASDMDFEGRTDVSRDECLRMAADKTGALLACACSLGADLVDADRTLVARLADFGEHVGLAFQFIDDLLGIWGDPARTGKAAGADLHSRKKSLPVVAALNAPDSAELRALYLRPEPLSNDEVARAADLVERGGGRDWARAEADRHVAAATESLEACDIPDAVRGDFLEVAAFITGRRF